MRASEMYKCQENIDAFNRIEAVLDQLEKDGKVIWSENGVLVVSPVKDCTIKIFGFWKGRKDMVLVYLANNLEEPLEPTAVEVHVLLSSFCRYYSHNRDFLHHD